MSRLTGILGQEKAVRLLESDLKPNRVADSYLFAGPQGVGKKATALAFAKALNCSGAAPQEQTPALSLGFDQGPAVSAGEDPLFCGECLSCRKIASGTHPDIFVLDFETQAQMLELPEDVKARQKDYRIESIRMLVQRAYLSPSEGQCRVFIIDGAELLNQESANALLKVVEESPRHSKWILIAVSPDRVISTIRSRCRKISFSPLHPAQVQEIISKLESQLAKRAGKSPKTVAEPNEPETVSGIDKKAAAIKKAAELSGGSVSLALSLLEEEFLELYEMAEKVIARKTAADPFQISSSVLSDSRIGAKKRAEQFLKVLTLVTSSELHRQPSPQKAEKLSLLLQSQEDLRRNVSPQLVLDSLFLSLGTN